ncbi:MAG: acetate--CoA ligase family protein [Armatimonadota bacterium]|nr:acetate--CoA ligase family protein [Armatimonadota bacterium]
MDPSLLPFFRPRGIVLVGASHDPAKLGYGVASNLIQSGYQGAIHFVNPRGGELLGRPVYTHLAAVPDPVDLAVLIVPAPATPDALEACGRRGIRAAMVLAGGFREVGPDGARLEAECVRIARDHQMRLLGPNCVGVIDTHLPLNATFLSPPGPIPGEVAFISHSGAICAAVTDWSSGQGFGLSHLISLGNQADVTETDVLGPVAEDSHTRVLTLYLEGIGDGRRFVEEARRVSRRKPVVALKVGRSTGGRDAVASHTGAMAGREAAYDAALRAAGVIRAQTTEEMFDWARALAWCPPPAGRNVAVLTNAGGPGVVAADAIEACGLRLARLGEGTQSTLRDLLPPAVSVRNPVDILASASPDQYAACLRLLLDDQGVDGVLVILPPPPRVAAEVVAQALVPVIRSAAKPVLVALMGERAIRRAAAVFQAARIPDYRFPERAASALAILARQAETLGRPEPAAAVFRDVRTDVVRELLAECEEAAGAVADQTLAGHILEAYGIPVVRVELARTAEEAVALARRIGFPVALKIASPDISHKSEVGGVVLDAADGPAVAEGFAGILARARAARPQARILGVHVQPMLPPGQEVIVGAIQDPQFKALVMFGSGGVEVESLRDVAFALAPPSREDVNHMMESTWVGRRLRGDRHLPPADREAVTEVVLRMGQLAADFPEIAEVEVNPLRVLPGRGGAVAVDVRLRVARTAPPSLASG